jgi:hypothetical protein
MTHAGRPADIDQRETPVPGVQLGRYPVKNSLDAIFDPSMRIVYRNVFRHIARLLKNLFLFRAEKPAFECLLRPAFKPAKSAMPVSFKRVMLCPPMPV